MARIFFVIESLHHKPTYNQPEGGELKVTGVMQELVVLLVDGEPVRWVTTDNTTTATKSTT